MHNLLWLFVRMQLPFLLVIYPLQMEKLFFIATNSEE